MQQAMLDRIDKVDGVKTAIGIDSIVGPSVPKDMIPQSVREIIEDVKYQMNSDQLRVIRPLRMK